MRLKSRPEKNSHGTGDAPEAHFTSILATFCIPISIFFTGLYRTARINMSIPETMKAVILKESYRVAVEEVPTPKMREAGDVLVKVHLAGLCGA
jgi:hypothetical protein